MNNEQPTQLREHRETCRYGCGVSEPYGFVIAAGCPVDEPVREVSND